MYDCYYLLSFLYLYLASVNVNLFHDLQMI